jgi:hypothetical protein
LGPASLGEGIGDMTRHLQTFEQAIAFGVLASQYHQLRIEHPEIAALTVYQYLRDDQGLTISQFECATKRGHSWGFTGSDYGGDDEGYRGEGRCYCRFCGADGDA